MSFEGVVRVEMMPSGDEWKLIDKFSYTTRELITIHVPEGYVTDFASVPRWAWSVVGPIGRHARAAVIHDFCYSQRWAGDRKWADEVFYEAMKESGVVWWRRWLIYRAVRWFGQKYWDSEG